jgi:TRAP-type C4-dicarboxylate transport system permease small subunit
MLFFSYKYVVSSTKITAALEFSYKYINASIIVAFALITFYSLFYAVKGFKKIFLDDSIEE